MDDIDEEIFEDAQDWISLDASLEAGREAVDKFLNNQFNEAREIVEPLSDRSIYHASVYGVIRLFEAMMTFEQKDLEKASTVLSQSCDTINRFRKKTTFKDKLGRILWNPDYNDYTDMEVHAELCFAEVLLMKALATVLEDETLASFVKAGLKVRAGYQSFKECCSILQDRKWDNDQHRKDFEGGVRLGIGTCHLVFSKLPAKITKLLEFIGFSGNRVTGIQELQTVCEDKDGFRQFLACLVLLGHCIWVSSFIDEEQCSVELWEEILQEKLAKHPNGAAFLFLKGRFHFVQGEMKTAIYWYKESCKFLEKYPLLCHTYYWELNWAHQYSLDWMGAYHYANLLFEESKWSKCFYGYLKAAMLCMVQDDLTEKQKEEQLDLMTNMAKWKKRIAGRSLTVEKFAIHKAERFINQGHFLVLPSLELIYLWNGLRILGQSYSTIEPFYNLVEKAEKKANSEKNIRNFFLDDISLINLLKGMCLKFMNCPEQAEECFKFVIHKQGQLVKDTYLVPYAQCLSN